MEPVSQLAVAPTETAGGAKEHADEAHTDFASIDDEDAAIDEGPDDAADQQAAGEQQDMRANDPACLFCDDGGKCTES